MLYAEWHDNTGILIHRFSNSASLSREQEAGLPMVNLACYAKEVEWTAGEPGIEASLRRCRAGEQWPSAAGKLYPHSPFTPWYVRSTVENCWVCRKSHLLRRTITTCQSLLICVRHCCLRQFPELPVTIQGGPSARIGQSQYETSVESFSRPLRSHCHRNATNRNQMQT